jgi:hypothetical protein
MVNIIFSLMLGTDQSGCKVKLMMTSGEIMAYPENLGKPINTEESFSFCEQ